MDNAPALIIDTETPYMDRSLPNAAWYDRHLIQPGRYEPILLRGAREAKPGEQATKIAYRVRTRLVETYRVNRLFTATSAQHRNDLDEPATVTFTAYPWEIERGSLPGLPDCGAVFLPADAGVLA